MATAFALAGMMKRWRRMFGPNTSEKIDGNLGMAEIDVKEFDLPKITAAAPVKISKNVATWALHTAKMSAKSSAAAHLAAKQAYEAQLSANNAVSELSKFMPRPKLLKLEDLAPPEPDIPGTEKVQPLPV